jgi:hypothetical protein
LVSVHSTNLKRIIVQPGQAKVQHPLLLINLPQRAAISEGETGIVADAFGVSDGRVQLPGARETFVAFAERRGREGTEFARTREAEVFLEDGLAGGRGTSREIGQRQFFVGTDLAHRVDHHALERFIPCMLGVGTAGMVDAGYEREDAADRAVGAEGVPVRTHDIAKWIRLAFEVVVERQERSLIVLWETSHNRS